MRTYERCIHCKTPLADDVKSTGACHCYECRREYDLKFRSNNPREYLFRSVKNGAARRGIEFSLTLEDIPEIPKHCPVLGIELRFSIANRECSPSIDRIDNSKGYVPGNIRVISFRANSLKKDATFEEIEKIYDDAVRLRGWVYA